MPSVVPLRTGDWPIGIGGDAPSTSPAYTAFLLEANIDSISASPDVVVEAILTVVKYEN